jgi:uncharacterized protein YneF (UPF0154 family)
MNDFDYKKYKVVLILAVLIIFSFSSGIYIGNKNNKTDNINYNPPSNESSIGDPFGGW